MASNFWRNVLGQTADAFVPGNAYNPGLGKWNKSTAITGLAGLAAGQVVPGGERLVGMAAERGMFGQGLANGLRRDRVSDALTPSYMDTRNQAAQYVQGHRPEVPNIGGTMPQGAQFNGYSGPRGGLHSMVSPLPTSNWQNTAFANTQAQAQNTMAGRESAAMQAIQNQINGSAPTRGPDASVLAMGGGSSNGGRGQGWTGVGGQMSREQFLAGGYQGAQSVFAGMRDSSNRALADAEYQAFVRGQRF